MHHHGRERGVGCAGAQEEGKEGHEEQDDLRVGEAHRQGLPEVNRSRFPGFDRGPIIGRACTQQVESHPAQVARAEPLQCLEEDRVGIHDCSQPGHRSDHIDEVAAEGAHHRAQSRAEPISCSGVQDGERARPRDQLEYDDRSDEASIVLDAEHHSTSDVSLRARFPDATSRSQCSVSHRRHSLSQ